MVDFRPPFPCPSAAHHGRCWKPNEIHAEHKKLPNTTAYADPSSPLKQMGHCADFCLPLTFSSRA
jgi:hypothetical protein